VFPHHENEVAQSECFTGKLFAKYWMHNGLMQMTGDKMSKSKGNLVTITELLQRHPPEAVRFFLLSTHYRRPIEFSSELIAESERGLDHFFRFFERYERVTGESFYTLETPPRRSDAALTGEPAEFFAELDQLRRRYYEAMDDDFNTGAAIGVLHELLTGLNRFVEERQLETTGKGDAVYQGALRRGAVLLKEGAAVLGVFRKPPERTSAGSDALTGQLLDLLVQLRADARKEKNFALADTIRNELKALQVELEDRPDGTTWRVGRS
jgi:cysteinyl-tRNA synthetase